MAFIERGPASRTNSERLFADRPTAYGAWKQLNAAVRENIELRRYELVTLAAAGPLRSPELA